MAGLQWINIGAVYQVNYLMNTSISPDMKSHICFFIFIELD